MIALTLFLGLAPPALGAAPAAVQRAVVAGELDSLERARTLLRAEIAATGEEPAGLYLRAYVAWRLSYFHERGSKASQALLEEAERDLAGLLALTPDDAEALALLATVDGSLITGIWSGLRRGPRSAKAYDRALQLAPANPRVVLLLGISRLFRPRPWGGGVSRAQQDLVRAQELFDREPADKPWPNWGRAEVLAWLGQAMLRKGDPENAEAYYRRALELEPTYDWVRRSLLPEIQER